MSLVASFAAGAVVVGRARVVRHGVARLDAELFEIERVAGRDLGRRLAAAEEADRLFRAAVHGIHQLQVRARRSRRPRALRRGTPARAWRRCRGPAWTRVTVGGWSVRMSMVYCGDASTFSPAGPSSSMRYEPLALGREVAAQRAVGVCASSGLDVPSCMTMRPLCTAIVGWMCSRTSVPRSVATSPPSSIVRGARPGVGREAIFEIELLDVRQLDDLQRERRRSHARRPRCSTRAPRPGRTACRRTRRSPSAPSARARTARVGALAREHRGLAGLEAVQLGRDRLIGALGHGGVARRHFDAIRRRRLDVARDDEQRRQRMAKVGRTEARTRRARRR